MNISLSDYKGAQFADPKTFVDGKVNAAIMLPKNGLGDMQSIMMPLRDALTAKGEMCIRDRRRGCQEHRPHHRNPR